MKRELWIFGCGLWVTMLPAVVPGSAGEGPTTASDLEVIKGHIETGVGYQSRDSFRFGRYTGLVEEGFFAILNLDWLLRAPYDSERGDFLRIQATDLGLDSRRATLAYGQQGRFVLRAEYDQIPAYFSDTTRTPFNLDDRSHLALPPDWSAAPTTAGMDVLLPALNEVDIKQRRRRAGLGVSVHPFERWQFSSDLREERRDGARVLAGVIGNSGGNPRAALLPSPVDYRTRQLDTSASYADDRRQFSLGYHLSLFDNDYRALTWDNPFSTIAGWDPAAGYPDGHGQLALPADNRFHQVTAAAGYTLSPRTRLTGNIAFGRMTQDQAFLPYTVNPVLAETITQPLPRPSLEGRIDTTVINLRLSTRPTPRSQLNLGYRLDDRDNRTPMDEYVYIGGDSQPQDGGEASSRRRFNLPYSYREHRLGADARYRINRETRLNASLTHRRIERDFSDRHRTDESTLALGLTRAFKPWLNAGISAEWADRGGSTYEGNSVLEHGFAPGYAQTVIGGWINVPGMRQAHLADRRRYRLAGNVNLVLAERWSITLEGSRARDNYRKSEIGLAAAGVTTGSLDISYAAGRDWSAHAFYTREHLRARQHGHSVRGGANKLPDLTNPERAWSSRHNDRIDTVGAGLERRWLDDRWRLSADYVYADSRARIDTTVGADFDSEPLPPVSHRVHALRLRADYRLSRNWTTSALWWYERYRADDWALDDVPVNQLANVILIGEMSPNYQTHIVALSLTRRH